MTVKTAKGWMFSVTFLQDIGKQLYCVDKSDISHFTIYNSMQCNRNIKKFLTVSNETSTDYSISGRYHQT